MRIKIIYGDAGGGHKAAACVISNAITELQPSYNVEVVEIFQHLHINLLTKLDDSVLFMSKSKILLSPLYVLSWLVNHKYIKNILNNLISLYLRPYFLSYLQKENPDIVISTHFLAAVGLGSTKEEYPSVRRINIITDLITFPALNADSRLDEFFVATQSGRHRLEKLGIKNIKINAPYFPLELTANGGEQKLPLHNKKAKQLVLFAGGGHGIVSMLKYADSLIHKAEMNYKIVIQAGKSNAVKTALEQKYKDKANIEVIGFVPNFSDLMSKADLVVAKPGPATILELEILKAKVLFTPAVGPQEEGNVPFLKHNPNFKYISHEKMSFEELVEHTLQKEYMEYEPRLSAKGAKSIVSAILEQ